MNRYSETRSRRGGTNGNNSKESDLSFKNRMEKYKKKSNIIGPIFKQTVVKYLSNHSNYNSYKMTFLQILQTHYSKYLVEGKQLVEANRAATVLLTNYLHNLGTSLTESNKIRFKNTIVRNIISQSVSNNSTSAVNNSRARNTVSENTRPL